MKTTFLLLSLTVFVFQLSAQSDKEEIDYIQSIFGMEKKATVAQVVKPDATQEDTFWKLYDDYEIARKSLGKKRIELLVRYTEKFETMDNKLAAQLLKESLTLARQNDKLLASYVKKISKATNPAVAMQFHQIEVYILSEVRIAITSSLPYPEAKQ